jgi:hypothetical protein
MGNKEGLFESAIAHGTNQTIDITSEIFFSYAFDNEIALVFSNLKRYYILNCTQELWTKVKAITKDCLDPSLLKKWWITQSKQYEINYWSNKFQELEEDTK